MTRTTNLEAASRKQREAIYALRDAVRDAVREYDATGDHLRHDAGADCLRCDLAAVVGVPPRLPSKR